MLNDLEVELYTDDNINPQIVKNWFDEINSHRFGTFETKPKAAAWHVGKPFFYRNDFLPGEPLSADKLYLTLLSEDDVIEDEEEYGPNSVGPDGIFVIILTDKPLKEVNTPEILAEYLREVYPKSIVGYDSHYVWLDGQLLFCHMWASQGIQLVMVRHLDLPYKQNFSAIQMLEGCINRFKERLEYED